MTDKEPLIGLIERYEEIIPALEGRLRKVQRDRSALLVALWNIRDYLDGAGGVEHVKEEVEETLENIVGSKGNGDKETNHD